MTNPGNQNTDHSLLTTRMFGKKFLIFSVIVVILTGIGVLFFDQTDDDAFMEPYRWGRDTVQQDTATVNPVTDTLWK